MGFRAPNRAAIEARLSQAARLVRSAIEDYYEQVEDLKVEVSDAGFTVNAAGAEAFAEQVLGVPVGSGLGQTEKWADALVDANTSAGNLKGALDSELVRLRRVVFD